MRFMFSRRWVTFFLVVVVLAYGCYLLGRWQFHRLHDRETSNIQITRNLKAPPAPVGDVLRVGRPAGQAAEWRKVTASGTYLPDESVIVRYQTRDGTSGVDVVTPLRTSDGTLLMVDRGWMQTSNVASRAVHPPAPPPGQVTVVGYTRTDATGGAAQVTDRSTRAISSTEIAKTVDGKVFTGFVDAAKESPAPSKPLVPAELPDLGNGPHFFYGLQWWFFGLLAVFGFCYLAYDERRRLARGETPGSFRPSERRAQMKESAGRGAP